jgi:hypothetical protein
VKDCPDWERLSHGGNIEMENNGYVVFKRNILGVVGEGVRYSTCSNPQQRPNPKSLTVG